MLKWILPLVAILLPTLSLASGATGGALNLHMTDSTAGYLALGIFLVSYIFVMTEELTELRKSKPVVLAAGLIWIIVAILCETQGYEGKALGAVQGFILEFSELFMFLLVAMTYVNAIEERLVFEGVRAWLVNRGFSYRQLFWVTGFMAFFISPIADNLTTALLMCAIVMAVGHNNRRFVALGCINIVVAANAGGAFSPFGDITTLMVWQKGILGFFQFFPLFIPALISFVVPGIFMHFAIPKEQPEAGLPNFELKKGAYAIIFLFIATIVTAVLFHNLLHLPPMLGMMTGLGYLNIYSFYLKKVEQRYNVPEHESFHPFDIFKKIRRAEWDTLFFFYGVIVSVGGLATLGYLELASHAMYTQWGAHLSEIHRATPANIVVGFLSAIVDNIPVMYAVLTVNPVMSNGQWLLVTLTAGIGGSMLSIGSAAGVALMGQSRGQYTFIGHLKWSWAILLGYLLAIGAHFWLSYALFYKAV